MPSKEEIEQAKRICKRVLQTDPLKSTIDFQYNDVDTLIEGLEQLEAEKKKVIEKLDELKQEYTVALKNNSVKAVILKSQIMILEEIMKGE